MNYVDAFLVYHLLKGNALHTALALEIAPEAIISLAATESWDEKIKDYNRPVDCDSKAPKNRVHQIFCRYQAMWLRALVGEIVNALAAKSPEALFMSQTKSATSFSTRAIAELVEIATTAQHFAARVAGEPDPLGVSRGKVGGSEISTCFVRAMAVADDFGFDAVALVRNVIKPTDNPV